MGATVPALCVTGRKLSDIFIHSERFKCNVFYHFMFEEKAYFLN
ncbi:diguanylate cyclase [Shigella dysenteriae]|uniref:Diguanylate cyclase n=2 Tax=Shigella TaxID=620 RepID=A0A1S9JCI1_SHIBO|nr:diguanylate cyclase [Escherichia coli]EGD7151584.1 diguanylate cyclase [Shigella dysenteriae]OOO80635.1 diguanylate cyclase [Shigella boydii]EGE2518215.1 diguanylate cyclase [Shigella dysenteriae]MLU13168.1 diguanylate cyclase [Shigella dysenteriae]